MLCASSDALGYPRHLHRAAHYKVPREDLSPPGEAGGGQIGFPQMAADTCANIRITASLSY